MSVHLSSPDRGFALTLTLIIVSLAAIIVVAFLTTTSTERTTAAAYGRLERAEQLANAGVDAAIARITTEMKYRPYHAIGYRSVNNGIDTEIVPVITGPRDPSGTGATYNTAPNANEDVYLISVTGGIVPGSASPAGLTTDNSVDLNANHLASEPKGWIGSPTTAATPIPYRAPWVEVLADPDKSVQPDPAQPDYNPVVGRYAYWIEDETSKLDVSSSGNARGAGGTFQRGAGTDVSDLDIGTLPLLSGSPFPLPDATDNTAVLTARAATPMLDARFLNRVGGQIPSDISETTKFYATVFGLSDELVGNGRRRVNINSLITSPASNAASVPPATIAANLDDIAYVITGSHLIENGLGPAGGTRAFESSPNFTNTLVTFGARFFSSPTPSAAQRGMYLERLASNIRDYIDTDSQPTVIDSSQTVMPPSSPDHSVPGGGASGANEVIAIGKENVPFLQEYMVRVKQITFDARLGAFANYKIEIDHYLEFWNMTSKDITLQDLGPNPFLRIANQFGWDGGTLDSIPEGAPRDFSIPLADFSALSGSGSLVFKANQATVVTTDPTPLPAPFGVNATRLFKPPAGTPSDSFRVYQGRTNKKSSSQLRLSSIMRPSATGTDSSTELILGNNFGVLESFGAPAVVAISVNVDTANPPVNKFDTTKYYFRASSLKGNIPAGSNVASEVGDPRTNNEQLSLNTTTSVNDDQTSYKSELSSASVPGTTTLTALNSNYVDPSLWPDPSPITADSAHAPAEVSNSTLNSIGQLGNVFDPARTIGPPPYGAGDISYSRGGGRTLKIGQPDDLNGVASGSRSFTAAWFNSAWRLTDLFDALPVADRTNAPLLSEAICAPTARGKLNVNGVLRDDGIALRAALRSYTFLPSPDSDPQLNGQPLPPGDIDNFVASLQAYLAANGPMMERGEISQISFFNPTTGNLGGQSLATTNDRGREEIFRRTVEMITTRSASFTVYAIGQAIRQERNASGWRTVPVGEHRSAVTFQLEPQMAGAPLRNSSLPHAAVDSYKVQKVYAPN